MKSCSFIIKETQIKPRCNISCKLKKIKQKGYASIGEIRGRGHEYFWKIFIIL